MLTHDVIQDSVNSLSVMEFLGDFPLVSSAKGADKWGEDSPTKGLFKVADDGVHALRFALTYCSLVEAPQSKLKVIQWRRCWTI